MSEMKCLDEQIETIGIIYNDPLPGRYDDLGEGGAVTGVLDAVAAVAEALSVLGYETQVLALKPPLSRVEEALRQLKVDVVFNLFEGFDDLPQSEAEVAYLLEKMGFCFTGSPGDALLLSQNKSVTKRVLGQHGIPTPHWQVFSPCNLDFNLAFPCIVKPLNAHASHGLSEGSVVGDLQTLARQIDFVQRAYGQPPLVEEFLPGREFCALVMGNEHPKVFPIEEIVYALTPGKPEILAYSAKWDPDDAYFRGTKVRCPAELSPEFKQEIEALALRSFLALGCRAYARVDMRQGKQGQVMVLDVNPNPDIGPGAGARLQAEAAGLDYPTFISEILSLAKEAFKEPCPKTSKSPFAASA